MIKKFPDVRDLQLSEKLIFKTLFQSGELNKNEIIEHIGGTSSTVYRMLKNLVDENLIIESKSDTQNSGRKPITYTINAKANYTFGAYLFWDVFGIGLTDITGSILRQKEWPLEKHLTPTDFVSKISGAMKTMAQKESIPGSKILGLNLATTGPLFKDKGLLYHPHLINLPNWEVIPIKDMLEMATGTNVTIHNLSTTALMGEIFNGKGFSGSRCAYLLIDHGLGCDIFIPGLMKNPTDDPSGLVGRMVINFKGKRKVLGAYVTLNQLFDEFREDFPDQIEPFMEKQPEPVTLLNTRAKLKAVRSIIDNNDLSIKKRKEKLLHQITTAFEVGILNYINLLNPKYVFYGGRVVDTLPEYFDETVQKIVEHRPKELQSPVSFHRSALNGDLFIKGGVYQVLDTYIGLSNTK